AGTWSRSAVRIPDRTWPDQDYRAGKPGRSWLEQPTSLGPRLVEHLAHREALRAGDAPHLVELRGGREDPVPEPRDLEGNVAVGPGEGDPFPSQTLPLIRRPADTDGRRLLEEYTRELRDLVGRAEGREHGAGPALLHDDGSQIYVERPGIEEALHDGLP